MIASWIQYGLKNLSKGAIGGVCTASSCSHNTRLATLFLLLDSMVYPGEYDYSYSQKYCKRDVDALAAEMGVYRAAIKAGLPMAVENYEAFKSERIASVAASMEVSWIPQFVLCKTCNSLFPDSILDNAMTGARVFSLNWMSIIWTRRRPILLTRGTVPKLTS